MANAGDGVRQCAAERPLLVAALVALFVLGYFGIGSWVAPSRARSLRTALDDRIPFVAESIFVYVWVYFAAFFPVFVVRCPRLFRRGALAYALVIGASLLCFALFPVSARELRPDVAALDPARFSAWGVRTLYVLDPPLNLFPSLHLAITCLAALVASQAGIRYAGVPFLLVAGVAGSICTVKQHFWVDAAAGLALAGVAHVLVLRPHGTNAAAHPPPARSERWTVAYLALVATCFLACYVAFLAGVEPWTWGRAD